MLNAGRHLPDDPEPSRLNIKSINNEHELSSGFQSTVAELGQLALESPSLPMLFKTVVTRLGQLLDADQVVIMEVEGDCRLVVKACSGSRTDGIDSVVSEWDAGLPYVSYPPILTGPLIDELTSQFSASNGVLPPCITGFTSALTVPVGRLDTPVGAIGAYFDVRHKFVPQELVFIKSVAQIVASAIERSRAEERIRRQTVESSILGEIARIMGSSLEIEEVYPLFTEQVARLIQFDRLTVSKISELRNTQHSTYVAGIAVKEWEDGVPQRIDGKAVESAVRARSGMIIQDENLADFKRRFPLMDLGESAGLRSMLTVPVLWKSEVICMLTLRSCTVNAYTQSDLHLVERIAAQIAGAIANSSLHHQQVSYAREQATLAEISRIIASSVRLEEIYPRFVESVQNLIPFDRISINTINEENATVTRRYVWGQEFEGSEMMVERPLKGTATGAVHAARAGLIITPDNILRGEPRFAYLQAGLDTGLRSTLAVPLIYRGKVIGGLMLRCFEENLYTSQHLAMAERVAMQISGPVWNVQLNEQLERSVREQELLFDLSTETIQAHDFVTVFEKLYDTLIQLIQFDRCVIAMFDADRSQLRYELVRGVEIKNLGQGSILQRPSTTSGVLWPEFLAPHYGSSSRTGVDLTEFVDAFNATGLQSWIQMPLKSRDRLIGVISLRSRRVNAYSRSDLLFLERIATQVAPAVDNVRFYQQAQEEAQQRAMLEEMLQTISQHADLDELLKDFVSRLRNSIPADRIAISHIGGVFHKLAATFNKVSSDGTDAQPVEQELNRQITAALLRIRTPLVVSDAPSNTPSDPALKQVVKSMVAAGYHSSLAVPLLCGGVIVGVMHFHSSGSFAYSDRFKAMAEQAGTLLASVFGPVQDEWRVTEVGVEDAPVPKLELSPQCSMAKHKLSESDVLILQAVANGLSNAEIAEQLNFAAGTIKNRLARIYRVFDVSDRAAAMAFAIRCGIVV